MAPSVSTGGEVTGSLDALVGPEIPLSRLGTRAVAHVGAGRAAAQTDAQILVVSITCPACRVQRPPGRSDLLALKTLHRVLERVRRQQAGEAIDGLSGGL
jgi:hypothetical protein